MISAAVSASEDPPVHPASRPGTMTEIQDYRGILMILPQRWRTRPEATWSRPFQASWNPRRNPRDISHNSGPTPMAGVHVGDA